MSDEQNGTPPSDEAPDRPARTPTPGASAASRARRIGGRPLPGPRTDEEPAARAAERRPSPVAGRAADTETSRRPAGRPARSRPAAAGPASERLRWIPAVVAAAALVAMLVLGVWQSHGVWWGNRFHDTRAQQQQQVLATAKSCAATILSYDYRHLDEDQQKGLACITGKFRDDYTQVLGFVRQSAPKLQAVQTLQIAKGGVQRVSKDGSQWVVLLYGQTVLTKGTDKPPTPRADITSAVVTLDQVGGKWLVSNMQTGG